MATDFRHLFLKNTPGFNEGFKKTRNVQSDKKDDDDNSTPQIPAKLHKSALKRDHINFNKARESRHEKRSIKVPVVIEFVKIHFLKVFNNSLRNPFQAKYGLSIVIMEGFNKTVTFEISNNTLFAAFIKDLEAFYNSPPNKSYHSESYNLISLIQSFTFYTSADRLKQYKSGILSISLMPPQNQAYSDIYNALIEFLKVQKKEIILSKINPDFFEVKDLSEHESHLLAENFDIIKSIIPSHIERRRPGMLGTEIRDYGFSVSVADNLPIVGIIDSGVHRIDPFSECITTINYDLTATAPYWDGCGHGTTVSGMVILGDDFLINERDTYKAKAKIAVIKAIHNENDTININGIIESILKARTEHGVRIFNMSLNEPFHKEYNSAFGEFAYMLDKIAYENDVLIFLSVGNILDTRLHELINIDPDPLHNYPVVFYSPENQSEIHSCESTNICSPSESLNNISIGALAGNFNLDLDDGITPAKEYPAYYTRKFHYDYNQKINSSEFLRSQKNRHLNKPDMVFNGGDLFSDAAAMEIICPPVGDLARKYYSRSCGTSLATPLITSLAAEILTDYPSLRLQTIKALLINNSASPCGKSPSLFEPFEINLLQKLIGHGMPSRQNLVKNNSNSITFVLESDIELNDLQTIKISLPEYLNDSENKINIRATLCYNFSPVKDNHLNYLPLQITFGFFKSVDADIMGKSKTQDYQIKTGLSWSDDFFGVENRLFSNVQKIDFNISAAQIMANQNQLSLAVKCTGKKEIPQSDLEHLQSTKHSYSIVFTITELPLSRAKNQLYNAIIAINNVEGIAETDIDITLENN